MKALLLSIIIILFSLQSFSQYHENYQPDSVYKINGIKARIMMHNRSKTKTKQLDLYDKQGRHTASIQVDTSGINYRSKTVFDYDSTGRLQHQYGINYYRLDSSTRKMLRLDANPDTNTVKIVYDSLNRISAKYWISAKGKKYFETFFTYNPLTTTEHQYLKRNDTDYINEAITIYELPEIASRRYGYYLDAKPGEPKRQRNNFDFSY